MENVAGNTYDKYASTNPIERRMMAGFFGALSQAVGEASPARVVELGCGEGHATAYLRERFPVADIVGLDLPDENLAEHWKQLGIPMMFADIHRLPFDDRTLDLVVALEVLEHVADPDRALGELARVCRGHAVVSVPREPIWRIGNIARGRYVRDLGNTPGHVNHWTSGGFRRLLERHFDVLAVWKPLPWTMARLAPRASGR
jgi:ubiquinone/menaquinone biosynthesis C-methylase UbiE